MEWKIPLADVSIGEEEKAAVMAVLDSRWLTMGAGVQQFEQEFAHFVQSPHALAVSNGTVALHAACLALGITNGDEVIMPALTFVADANVVVQCGAEPVFADIQSLDDLTISPEAIEKAITKRTRAIIVMHYGGYACAMPQIMEIAHSYHLPIIEDAAHAPGAQLEGRPLGTWGDIGCFSFFSNKNMTTGEGGMVVTGRQDLFEKLGWIRSHGMTTLTWDRHQGHAWSYDVCCAGCNYRLDEIRAALGRVQLKKLEGNNLLRAQIAAQYSFELNALDLGIGIPFLNHPGKSAHHLFVVLLPKNADRTHVIQYMKAAGIQTSLHYPPIHQFTFYQMKPADRHFNLDWTEVAAQRLLTLPLYPTMTPVQVTNVVKSLQAALA